MEKSTKQPPAIRLASNARDESKNVGAELSARRGLEGRMKESDGYESNYKCFLIIWILTLGNRDGTISISTNI